MNAIRRAGHVAWSLCAAAWFAVTKRGATILFTHYADMDASGVDQQMGPLVDRLRAENRPFVEVTFVPMGGLVRNWRRKRRLFISHAGLHAVARLIPPRWSPDDAALGRARTRVAGWLLRWLRPSCIVLIDESGSGQSLVRAARQLGIRTVGVQHGDFHADNGDYVPQPDRSFEVAPVDVLCVWSDWFRARLTQLSPIYSAENTQVTGRVRASPTPRGEAAPDASRRPGVSEALGVLLVSEAAPTFPARVEPFLAALRAAPEVRLAVRPHPAEPRGWWSAEAPGSLADAFATCDVVIGVRSSAVLEAIHHGRPVVLLGDDPAGYADVATVCREPADLVAICRTARVCPTETIERRRQRVWGVGVTDAVGSILGSCGIRVPAIERAADFLR